jgi:glycosyltransferase involved in cell wall biosynthesis
MNAPIATIVVTTRDRPDMLVRAVSTALAQTVADIEVIVVDDGSIHPVALDETDPRLRVERLDESRGTCEARNHGLERARGQWITFLDDDDELIPAAIEIALQAAKATTLPPPVGVLAAVEVVNTSGRVVDVRAPRNDLPARSEAGRHSGLSNALFVPTEVLRSIGGWDQHAHPWEHTELLMRLDAVCSIRATRDVTYRMNDHPGARRHRDWLAGAEALVSIQRKHHAFLAGAPARRASLLASAGALYLKAGRWGPAVRTMSRAVVVSRFQPRIVAWWLAAAAGPWVLPVRQRMLRRHENGSEPSREGIPAEVGEP